MSNEIALRRERITEAKNIALHPLFVRSRRGAASCFAVSVPLDARQA